MNTLYNFILTLFQHGYKVRHSTLLHLLNGKRTSSILIYGFFYDNLSSLGLYPHLSTREFNAILTRFTQKKYVAISGKQGEFVQLTPNGHTYLSNLERPDFSGINSFLYSRIDDEFYDLLLFSSQVVSEMTFKNKQYTPIEMSPRKQNIIRFWLKKQANRRALGGDFFKEWQVFFHLLPERHRDGVSLLLTGHQQIGLTFQQLCQQQGWDPEHAYLLKKNYLHQLLEKIRKNDERLPLFSSLLSLIRQPLSNQSALASNHLFLMGADLASICDSRKLKQSTVSDHLIEGAILSESFPYQRLIDMELSRKLSQYREEYPDFRNWHYQRCLDEIPNLSFLEFRLFQIISVRGESR